MNLKPQCITVMESNCQKSITLTIGRDLTVAKIKTKDACPNCSNQSCCWISS